MTDNGSLNNTEEGYIPGVCNIGKEEVSKRRNGAVFAGLLCIAIIIILPLVHADRIWRFVLFFPATSLGVGIQQWSNKFCVGFGLKGIFNFKQLGESVPVEQQEMLKADKAKAIQMIVIGLTIGLALTIGFYLIPQ